MSEQGTEILGILGTFFTVLLSEFKGKVKSSFNSVLVLPLNFLTSTLSLNSTPLPFDGGVKLPPPSSSPEARLDAASATKIPAPVVNIVPISWADTPFTFLVNNKVLGSELDADPP